MYPKDSNCCGKFVVIMLFYRLAGITEFSLSFFEGKQSKCNRDESTKTPADKTNFVL